MDGQVREGQGRPGEVTLRPFCFVLLAVTMAEEEED